MQCKVVFLGDILRDPERDPRTLDTGNRNLLPCEEPNTAKRWADNCYAVIGAHKTVNR